VIVEPKHQADALAAAAGSETPIITCPLPTLPQMAASLQVDDYLFKPVSRSAVRQILAQRPDVSTVLVGDDEPAMVRLLARMLRADRPNLRILQAHDGLAVLNIARRERPDLLLLDLKMPDLDGLGVLRVLRGESSLREIPVVVITATGLGEQAAQFGGELSISITSPVAAAVWFQMLQGIMTALQPVPGSEGTSAPMPVAALPG
jgi:CheY-like chemotaxis protein